MTIRSKWYFHKSILQHFEKWVYILLITLSTVFLNSDFWSDKTLSLQKSNDPTASLCHQCHDRIKSTFARSNMIGILIHSLDSHFCSKLDVLFARSCSLHIGDADLNVHRNHPGVLLKCKIPCSTCTSNQHPCPGPYLGWQGSREGARKFKFWLF